MSVELLTERYSKQIAGTVSCYDRILIFGTLPRICFAEGMTSLLYQLHVRIFDYPRFAEPFRDQLRENAEKLAADHGIDKLQKLSRPSKDNDRSFPGFNFFDPDDQLLFETIARGEYNISGLQKKDLRRHLIHKTQTQISRQLKRLRLHGLIKKIGRTYKYYLTSFGKLVITTGLKLKNLVIIPQLALTPKKS